MRSPLWVLLLVAAMPASAGYTPDLSRLPQTPRFVLPAAAVQTAVDDAKQRGQPQQFAVGVAANLRLSEGRWEAADAATAVWRIRLVSSGAHSLNLALTGVRLPPGAELRFYDHSGRHRRGPYTRDQISADGRLWTAAVPADDAVLELRVPADATAEAALDIARVHHGYRKFSESSADGKSGACNIDVACPQGDAWRDEIRSVAMITIGGDFQCSGQLINNVRQDLTPYFITADHCLINETANTPAESVVFYWNYQTGLCAGSPDGTLDQNQSGSTFIADNRESDFTLVRLAQAPLEAFNVYYAGFDAGGAAPLSGAGIHHPSGGEKRISLFSTPATESPVTIGGSRRVEAWRVTWAQGTTEQGSSGSGLWNQEHRLVGVLSGGEASCENTGGPDYYGRLAVGWEAAPQKTGQLKANLDPDNSGVLSVPGRDPQQPAQALPPPAPATPAPAASTTATAGKYSLGGGALDAWLLTLLGFVGLKRARLV